MRGFSGFCVGFALFLSASLLASPAVAQNGWSGIYVGVGIGGKWSDSDATIDFERQRVNRQGVLVRTFADQVVAQDDDESFIGFVRLGYDFQLTNAILIGAFVDHDFGGENTVDFSDATLALHPRGPFSTTGSFEFGDATNIGGRIGFLVNPQLLVYAEGGYSRIEVDGSATMVNRAGRVVVALTANDHLDGFFIGGGTEFRFTPNLALNVGYRYADYDSESFFAATPNGRRSISANAETEMHSVRVGLIFRLGQ